MKSKRILPIVIAVILLLAGCSNSNQPIETTSPEPPSPSSAEGQLSLLLEQSDVWLVNSGDESEKYYYAVTDFDQNGRLELFAASTQGTGIFTYGSLYEVNEDYTGLTLCHTPCTDEGDLPEVIINSAPGAYDPDSGTYSYLFTNDTRNGAAEQYQSIVALSLNDGTLSATVLANSYTKWIDAGIEEHEYVLAADDAFVPISASQYDSVISNYQNERQVFTANFEWQTFDSSISLELLQSSYETFRASIQASLSLETQ